jgi:preprotein translocase subunit SecA
MNDQRQVIFSQRLKILREDSIGEILNDFFEEILEELKITVDNYKKSNDEKYLTLIKNVTGNSLSDDNLAQLSSKDEESFLKEMKELFFEKRKSRINILGEIQNKSLEKKIFIQIIDFSWRSHLQYLEQLRQVIGLRQYGQKDPLSEFKKEAFVLFEGLLSKIKNDVIKLLLNLNIVVSPDEKTMDNEKGKEEKNNFKKTGRNEKCPCGSGKKFKHCHGNL